MTLSLDDLQEELSRLDNVIERARLERAAVALLVQSHGGIVPENADVLPPVPQVAEPRPAGHRSNKPPIEGKKETTDLSLVSAEKGALIVMREAPEKVMTTPQVRERMKRRGFKGGANAAAAALSALTKKGDIERVGRGEYRLAQSNPAPQKSICERVNGDVLAALIEKGGGAVTVSILQKMLFHEHNRTMSVDSLDMILSGATSNGSKMFMLDDERQWTLAGAGQ